MVTFAATIIVVGIVIAALFAIISIIKQLD